MSAKKKTPVNPVIAPSTKKKEEPKKFLVDERPIVKFAFDSHYRMHRITDTFEIYSKEDLTHDPDAKMARIDDELAKIKEIAPEIAIIEI